MPFDEKQWLDIGPAELSWNSVVLGATVANPDGGTQGGVRVLLTHEIRDALRDARGAKPYDRIIVGQDLRIRANLTGMALDQLVSTIPGATLSTGPAKKQLKFNNPAGTSLRSLAEELLIKPIVGGAVSTNEEDWINVPLATPVSDFELVFSNEDQKVYAVEFSTFDDLTTGLVATIGEDAAE